MGYKNTLFIYSTPILCVRMWKQIALLISPNFCPFLFVITCNYWSTGAIEVMTQTHSIFVWTIYGSNLKNTKNHMETKNPPGILKDHLIHWWAISELLFRIHSSTLVYGGEYKGNLFLTCMPIFFHFTDWCQEYFPWSKWIIAGQRAQTSRHHTVSLYPHIILTAVIQFHLAQLRLYFLSHSDNSEFQNFNTLT